MVDLRFRKTDGSAFGQGIWRSSANFANWVLKMMLMHSINQRIESSKHSESFIKLAKTNLLKHVASKMGSLNFKKSSSNRVNSSLKDFSNRKAVAYRQGEASVQS